MGSYNSINFTKLIVNSIPYNKAYMGSKILFENSNPLTLEITGYKDGYSSAQLYCGKGSNTQENVTFYITCGNNTYTSYSKNYGYQQLMENNTIVRFKVGDKIKVKAVYDNNDTPVIGNNIFGAGIALTGCYYKVYGDLTTFNANGFYAGLFTKISVQEGNELTDISGIIWPETVSRFCYYWMFWRQSSLTQPIDLPATTLAYKCYTNMFKETGVTDITMHALDYSPLDASSAEPGGFKDFKMTDTQPANGGVFRLPEGNNLEQFQLIEGKAPNAEDQKWTIQTIQEEPEFDYSAEYLTFKNVSEDDDIWVYWKHEWDSVEEDEYGLDPDDYNLLIQYSFDKETWVNLSAGPDTENNTYNRFELQHGQTVYIKGNGYRYMISGEDDNYYGYFEFTNQYQSDELVEVSGNIMSMVAGDNFQEAEFANNGGLPFLFQRNTGIVSAENLIIPANNTQGCFRFLFNGCSNMVKGPKITETDTPAQFAYNGMFYGCSSLTSISIDSPYTAECYNNWLNNASTSGTIYYTDDSWQNAPTGTSGIPSGWTATKVS